MLLVKGSEFGAESLAFTNEACIGHHVLQLEALWQEWHGRTAWASHDRPHTSGVCTEKMGVGPEHM